MRDELYQRANISIHAPREGCDGMQISNTVIETISIHAPREGCDIHRKFLITRQLNFNPRTP